MTRFSELDEDRAEMFRRIAARALHEEGVRSPTRTQIEVRARRVLRSFDATQQEKGTGNVLVLDYTGDLLQSARKFRRERQPYLSCVLYATWAEHKLNQWIWSLANKKSLPVDDIQAMIRETQHRAKIAWLLRILGAPNVPKRHRLAVQQMMERRNAFVHYKWRQHRPSDEKAVVELLKNFERTVAYFRQYEERVFGIVTESKAAKILAAVH